MSIKKFGAKDINLISPTGTPNITSPGELNLNASTVAISTDLSIGGEITSDLDVVGVATFQDTAVFNGSVGIGTTVPQAKLEVIGDVRIGNDLIIGNNISVSGILTATIPNLIVSDDDRNTFIGEDSGGTYDASTGAACYNVAIGYNAAECLTTGQNNVFLGRYAGHENTCGNHNIFIGCGAGHENTCGNNNFFGGYQAGRNASRALCSTHIGYFAGNKSCGDSNIFIGSYSGQCTTGNGASCGNGNIFLGKNSGCANVTGCYNILLGEEAGRSNAGHNNIILGHLAGCLNTGGENVIIGCQAGRVKVAGNGNTFLGTGAGNNSTGGANNVIIGRDVNPPTLSGSNQLAIGAPTGTWINGDSSFNVGIGTDDPSSKLQVRGTLGLSASDDQEPTFPGGRTQLSSGASGFILNHNDNSNTIFQNQGSERLRIYANGDAHFTGNVGVNTTTIDATAGLSVDGHVYPSFDNTHDLGSNAKRWRNIYTTDLQLSNRGKTNDVDGTWGDYTIQEGEEELYLINHRNGKKYKFMLQEVN